MHYCERLNSVLCVLCTRVCPSWIEQGRNGRSVRVRAEPVLARPYGDG